MVTLRNVLLSPPACGKREVKPGTMCRLACHHGYSLQGDVDTRCLSSGDWSTNVHKATCTDSERPWIQCPRDVVAETDERRGTANISWKVPTATDNSGEEVLVQVKPVYTPPQLFPIGEERIIYTATDRAGNQANCTFTVTVIGEVRSQPHHNQPSDHNHITTIYHNHISQPYSEGKKYLIPC
uniref:Sushi domain-containing protein n=1 Tax=Hucho hucho TaxID=62062 RepID=A0A4W5M048_9TELE